jgi:hypothetical protein
MAFATTGNVGEFWTTGSNNNGGWFDTASGGTDYTQQASPQLALTDLATDGAGTGLSSSTGGFTAAMVGNAIHILSGTGFTPGWYRITAYTDTNNVTIDRSAGSSATAGTGNVGGAMAVPTDEIMELRTAGNILYFKGSGTFTLTENISSTIAGDNANILKIEGYTSTRGDNPTGTDMPLIACGAYTLTLSGLKNAMKNLRFTTTNASGVRNGTAGRTENCEAVNSSGTANRAAFYGGLGSIYHSCYGESTNGRAFYLSTTNVRVLNCFAKDSADAVYCNGNYAVIDNCVLADCTRGVNISLRSYAYISRCTIDDMTIGISATTATGCHIFNNNITNCTTGANWNSGYEAGIILDYNNWYGNTTDKNNITKGDNATANDPEYTDAANDDYSTGSNVQGTGFPGLFPGSATTSYSAQGAVQSQGGGGERVHGCIT